MGRGEPKGRTYGLGGNKVSLHKSDDGFFRVTVNGETLDTPIYSKDEVGIRWDNGRYKTGDALRLSTDIYEDPDTGKTRIQGKLDGTSAKRIGKSAERSEYGGKHIYIILGDSGRQGDDADEVIIRNAKVLKKLR